MNFPFYQASATEAHRIAPGQVAAVNVGLWFTRFYSGFAADWSVADEGKRDWIKQVVGLSPSGDAAQIQALLARQRAVCTALGGQAVKLETQGNLVTGTGLSHPVENGFTFHPLLGMPYLPAAGVKGLLRGWVEVWMNHSGEAAKQALISRWFGTSKGADQNGQTACAAAAESAGSYVFFDALPSGPVHLACDVMTPHMGQWYERGADYTSAVQATTAPADWHSPVPVPFLVVKSGTDFHFMVAPRLTGNPDIDRHTCAELPQVLEALKNALEWLGAGAKTAVGYGRMVDREVLTAQQTASNLEAAGIQTGEAVWDANLTWNKGKSSLEVKPTDNSKKPFTVVAPKGKAHLDLLTETSRNKLDKGKAVRARVRVKILGNQTTLIAIEETS